MWKIIPLAILQSVLLCGGQVFLKFALIKMPAFSWTKDFWVALLSNWQFAACGLLFGAASLLWMYIVKYFPFATAYPMISLSYVFGMLAAIAIPTPHLPRRLIHHRRLPRGSKVAGRSGNGGGRYRDRIFGGVDTHEEIVCGVISYFLPIN